MNDVFAIVRFGDYAEYLSAIDSVDIDIVDSGSSLLTSAISYSRPEIVQDLIMRGININYQGERGMTPLQITIQWKNFELAKQLVSLGADVNVRDLYGNNALWYATAFANGNYDVVKLIVEKGGDAITKNNAGRSPLDFARQIGDEELIELLSAAGLPHIKRND
jgi:FOG: Ankyrin repeat